MSGPLTTDAPQKYWLVAAYPPFGAKYETVYVVFLATATGCARFTVCQPDAVSPLNVTEASSAPVADHRCPDFVPTGLFAGL